MNVKIMNNPNLIAKSFGSLREAFGKSVTKIANIRDEYLVELQKLRKKYEKKLR